MKKFLMVLIALSCIFFASCGNMDDTSVPDSNPNSSEQSGGGDSSSDNGDNSSSGGIWTPPSAIG